MKFLKLVLSFGIVLSILSAPAFAVTTLCDDAIDISAPSAVLMEKSSAEIIYEKDAHKKCYPASVTKVMTMLLIVEAIENGELSLDDTVIASERAASFGGSCVYLEEGEKMSVHEMLKCITVVSANDCAVAMSEHMCGTEQGFVQKMNRRAAELGLRDTHFTNCTGLFSDREHYTSAYDVAIMSRELISHELIKEYSTIWMDSIRNGEFGLSNTNKLVYYYEGCTGLKTGFTNEAMYCLSATAERDGVEYIAVIMGAESSDKRNNDAKTLLSYGFANYALCRLECPDILPPVAVRLGTADSVQPIYSGAQTALVEKSEYNKLGFELKLVHSVKAPVAEGQRLGTLHVSLDGKPFRDVELVAASSVEEKSVLGLFLELIFKFAGIA